MKYATLFIPFLTFFCSPAAAQKTTAPSPVSGGIGRTTNPGLPTTNTNPFPSSNPNNTVNNTNSGTLVRPIYISGKVIMEDGTPPPDFVRIEKICGGNPRPQGYTDSKGRFSFQLDSGIDVMSDASDARGASRPGALTTTSNSTIASRSMSGCDLRASLPGFRSDSVNLAFHGSFDEPNVGSIVLHRMGNVEGTTISMTSLAAPKDAQKAFQKGRDALKKEKTDEAGKNFQKAVDDYPKYAAAWFELGRVQVAQDHASEARKSFQQSIDADGKFVSPYLQLALLSLKAKDWQNAADLSERAMKLDPVDFPDAFFYNAIANLNLQKLDAAKKSALEAQKLDTQHRISQLPKLLDAITALAKPTAER